MSWPIWQRDAGAPPPGGGPPKPGGGAPNCCCGGGAPNCPWGGGAPNWGCCPKPPGRSPAGGAAAMGVPQTLQNLSVGLATVPHCAQALMVRPSMPSATLVPTGEPGAQGQHN